MTKKTNNAQDVYMVRRDTKLFEVVPNVKNNSYSVTITFPSQSYYADKTTGIIDTGASNTIISLKALFGTVSNVQRDIIAKAGSRVGAYKNNFSSAKGKGDLSCLLCSIPEITIEGRHFRNFPFYLLDDVDKSLVLIGYDFISSCDVVQQRNGSMTFYNFSRKDMQSKFPGQAAVLNLLTVFDNQVF